MGIAVLVLFAGAVVVLSPLLALIALFRAGRLEREVQDLRRRLDRLGRDEPSPSPAARPAAAVAAPLAARPAPPAPLPPTAPPAARPPDAPRPTPPPAAPRPASPLAPASDFATNLGPRILVATGAVAFTVFLGLFVKYAWENNWVGPAGRVLIGAATSVTLVWAGLRLLGREYRPLGQGLAGAGVAGLYLTAFGAHAFYDLIGREAAGLLMAAITVNAVVLAARLDTRLLAGLAWVGAYLTPVLLSTGEDKALALYLYLFLLALGALAIDHRKPWPETVPLAMTGTFLLYAAWYGQFYRPERFGVAALGVVVFTALFALGSARKARPGALGMSLLAGAVGVAALGAGADRPEWLLVLSLGLVASALRASGGFRSPLALVAAVAAGLPLLVWAANHYRPDRLELTAAWVVGAALLFVLEARPVGAESTGGDAAWTALSLVGAGVASVFLAGQTDRPRALAVLFLALAGVATLARSRWAWAEAAGLAGSALSIAVWMDFHYRPHRGPEALLLTLPVAGAYLVALVVRGLRARAELPREDALVHLLDAGVVWTVLHRVLYATDPRALGLASLALAAGYLALGAGALKVNPADRRQAQVLLGLAAIFVTLAIPVQLGLHGITLAWALEGLLLLGLGLRYGSGPFRAGGYVVLGLAVIRLLARHAPGSQTPFTPVLNAPFGTWLFVIAALAGAAWMCSRAEDDAPPAERLAVPALTSLALVLLFSLLTWESSVTFDLRARMARLAGDAEAARGATLAGRLALSVLWTVYATGLLGGGLALRSRSLFYAAYALFAVTAFKVVFVDLATLHALYRMLSFLALALLLLAGAYLNLRFRARLLPRAAAS
jgi:uncharacterized membrane protein